MTNDSMPAEINGRQDDIEADAYDQEAAAKTYSEVGPLHKTWRSSVTVWR